MNEKRIPKKIFNWEYETGVNNWCTDIGNIFNDINCSDCFNNRTKCDVKDCLKKLEDEYVYDWNLKRIDKPKLRLYNTFKHDYSSENYVRNICDKQIRSHLAQLRAGILPINIELGRHKGLEIKDRLCTLCNLNEVEDEIHFMCKCPAYDNFRQVLYNDVGINVNNCNIKEQFNILMSLSNKNVGRYVVDCFKSRRNTLYKR